MSQNNVKDTVKFRKSMSDLGKMDMDASDKKKYNIDLVGKWK